MVIREIDIRQNLSAVWGIFRGRPEAIRGIDASYEGFWRSFGVIALVVPIYIPYVMSEYSLITGDGVVEEDFSLNAYLVSRVFSLLVDWVAFPLMMAAIAGPLGIAKRYAPYITAYNWSNLIVVLPLALPGILYGFGLVPGQIATLLLLAGLAVFVRTRYTIARAALNAQAPLAIGLVALDFGLGLLVAGMFDRMAGL